MTRTVRIATTSLATLEDTAPPYNLRYPNPADTLQLGLALLDGAGGQGADLAVLPEAFMAAGLPGKQILPAAQPVPGPAFNQVAEKAALYHMYVVAGFHALDGDHVDNIAVLIDREGRLVGTYSKQHPTEGEIACGVMPGDRTVVLDTDFGRVGMAVCFDLNWPDMWAEFARQRADLVCWISAYPGGLPLQAYAWTYQYPIVTSVWPYDARVIDITGRIVAQSSRWNRLALHNLNLDKRLFHTDGQMQQILPIQARYGQRIRLEAFTDEHLFTLESNDPSLPVGQIIEEFGLVDYQSFLDRCTVVQERARA